MALTQLIYASRPFGYDGATLASILTKARHLNKLAGITGCLICREDIYLQMLEGPPEAIDTTYARNLGDRRHVDIELLWSGTWPARLFPDWDMRHDPARSWLWTPEEVWAGAAKKAPLRDIRATFARIAAEPYDEAGSVL